MLPFLIYFQRVAIATFLRKQRHMQDGRSKLHDTKNLTPSLLYRPSQTRSFSPRLAATSAAEKNKTDADKIYRLYLAQRKTRCLAANKNGEEMVEIR